METKPISVRQPPVVVMYDCKGHRKTKRFDDPCEARRFYTAKFKLGKSPKVRKI